MSRQVWKFEVPIDGEWHELEIPQGALRLHTGMQLGTVCVWVEVTTTVPLEKHLLRVFGTGHDLPPGVEHCGTTQSGGFVWHLYERLETL